MLFPTHILFGIIFYLLFADFFSPNIKLFAFFLVLFGSILPDIDSPTSKINRWMGFFGKIATKISSHRGYFHSLLFSITVSLGLWYFFGFSFGLALFLGYCAHIVGDSITPMGVAIFYPFTKIRIRGPIRAGSVMETILFILLAGIILIKSISISFF